MANVFLGIDGCRSGWAIVEISHDLESCIWNFFLFSTIKDVHERYFKACPIAKPDSNLTASLCPGHPVRQILIDIPIGLKESGPEERKCDKDARRFLGPKRGSSVFRAPARKIVYCDEGYKEASTINFNLTGKKISKQTFYICKKIREVDEFIESIKSNSNLISVIHESHPEVCFEYLAGKKLNYSKKRKQGFNERLEIIRLFNKDIDSFLIQVYKNFNKAQVKPDDLLDAAILAITAKTIYLTGKICRISEEFEFDSKGIQMEIVFS